MIKFLKKFFNLGQPSIYDEIDNPKEPNEINTSWPYKRMRKYSAKNEIEEITNLVYLYFNEEKDLINGCLEQSIVDGDLVLFRELFLRQRRRSVGYSLTCDNILDYAAKALKNDKANVFEYLIDYYHSQYSDCVEYSTEFKVRHLLLNYIIENKKTDYFDILKKYKLMNFSGYITEILEDFKFPYRDFGQQNIERITFILTTLDEYVDKKDLSGYIYRATTYHKKVFPPAVMELFDNFDFVKKRNESKKLAEELNDELKPSTELKKPKKLKV
jgi:hypothetical protein